MIPSSVHDNGVIDMNFNALYECGIQQEAVKYILTLHS